MASEKETMCVPETHTLSCVLLRKMKSELGKAQKQQSFSDAQWGKRGHRKKKTNKGQIRLADKGPSETVKGSLEKSLGKKEAVKDIKQFDRLAL